MTCALASLGSSEAAQYYFVPRVEATAEEDTNIELEPGGAPHVQGYGGSARADIGIATPRSDTTLQPEIDYTNYPSSQSISDFRARLSLKSMFQTQRSQFFWFGYFDRADTTFSELASAVFNPLDPTLRPNPDTGVTRAGTTRTMFYLAPTYVYEMSTRIELQTEAYYQRATYTNTLSTSSPGTPAGFTDFDFFQLAEKLAYKIDPLSTFSVGPYASRFETSASATYTYTNAYGLQFQYDHRWSPIFRGQLTASVERDDDTQVRPTEVKNTATYWQGAGSLVYEGTVSTTRLILDRVLSPSGAGVKTATDEVRLQHSRDLSQRFNVLAAVRYLRNHSIGIAAGNYVQDYARATLEAEYRLTPVWFVSGGYEYTWQRFSGIPAAYNHQISITFGYQGLRRRK